MPDPSTFTLHEITALILAAGVVLNAVAKVLREQRLARRERKAPARPGKPPRGRE